MERETAVSRSISYLYPATPQKEWGYNIYKIMT